MDKELKTIADYYGLRTQMRQLIEEMAELTQVICKAERYDLDTVRDHLAEEIADVWIVLEQVDYLLGDNEVQRIKAAKIERQKRRISDAGGKV
jgi:NTP pyrophosphatase (non-canonical NTP hydrolase)